MVQTLEAKLVELGDCLAKTEDMLITVLQSKTIGSGANCHIAPIELDISNIKYIGSTTIFTDMTNNKTHNQMEGDFNHCVGGTNDCINMMAEGAYYQREGCIQAHKVTKVIHRMYHINALVKLMMAKKLPTG
ncbi:hypothetical protein HDU81_000403 [Chytriomyces hyalinus]|nr:hypothetical protein HDU81_000403 [Chytriomyces hyalinus]